MKRLAAVLGIALTLFAACGTAGPMVSPSPTVTPKPAPTLTQEQMIVAAVGARFRSNFYSDRADCIQAIDDGTAKQCVFPTGVERITGPEWEQLFPDTAFYLVDISGRRSREELLAHETPNSGPSRHLVAWQNGQAYRSEAFDRLLEANAVTVTETNRELIAKSFALTSIPNYLSGDVLFLEWGEVDPGTYRHKYTHYLKAWTEIWGCQVHWWFVFTDQRMSVVTLGGGPCNVSDYGDYVEDSRYFEFDCEHVPLGVPPYAKDYQFNR